MEHLHEITAWMNTHREYGLIGMIVGGGTFLFFFGMFVQCTLMSR